MRIDLFARLGALAFVAGLMPAYGQPVAAPLGAIIVTAAPDPEDPPVVAEARARLAHTPGAVAIVAAETYQNRLATGFPDLLQNVPGIVSQKRYGEESRLSIRGSGLGQAYHQRGVLIAEDGVPFADADGFSDFQKVDALGARYIEVYKGGNALRFGGAQLGGAVNLITPTGRTAAGPNALRVEGGSFGTLRGRGAIGHAGDRWDVFASLDGLAAQGYRDWSEQLQYRGAFNAGYRFADEREIRLIVTGGDIDQQVPGTLSLADALRHPQEAGAGVIAQRWKRDQRYGRVSLQTRWRFGESLSFDGGLYGTLTRLHHPISIVIDQEAHNEGAFGRFDWNGEVGGMKADLFWGVSYRRGAIGQALYVNAGGAKGFQFGDSRQTASGLDVFAEGRMFVLPQLALVAGGSYGHATRDYVNRLDRGSDSDRGFGWFAPRLGLLWQGETGAQVYANVTRSVEPPHFGALVQAPLPGFVAVAPQDAWTFEIGARGREQTVTWDVSFFRSAVEGELLNYAVFGLPSAFFNAGMTTHQGVEASLDWRVMDEDWGSVLLRQTYTWSDFRFQSDDVYGGNRLPIVPEHQYRAELRYSHPDGWFVAPSIDWRPARVFADYANTLTVPGYALVGVSSGWTISDALSIFVEARNLSATRYIADFGAITDASDPAANKAVFYPGEGRSVFAGLSVSL